MNFPAASGISICTRLVLKMETSRLSTTFLWMFTQLIFVQYSLKPKAEKEQKNLRHGGWTNLRSWALQLHIQSSLLLIHYNAEFPGESTLLLWGPSTPTLLDLHPFLLTLYHTSVQKTASRQDVSTCHRRWQNSSRGTRRKIQLLLITPALWRKGGEKPTEREGNECLFWLGMHKDACKAFLSLAPTPLLGTLIWGIRETLKSQITLSYSHSSTRPTLKASACRLAIQNPESCWFGLKAGGVSFTFPKTLRAKFIRRATWESVQAHKCWQGRVHVRGVLNSRW